MRIKLMIGHTSYWIGVFPWEWGYCYQITGERPRSAGAGLWFEWGGW